MPTVPGEELLLEAAAAALQAATGSDFFFEADADQVWVVDGPQIKYVAEYTHGYLVHPGDVIFQVDTSCTFRISGDFLVTAIRKIGTPELPWKPGYVSFPGIKLKMVQDIIKALNAVELVPALGKRTAIAPEVVNRNLDLEHDGRVMAQVQFSFAFTEVIG